MPPETHRRRLSLGKWLTYFLVACFLIPLAARSAMFLFEDRPRSWNEADWSSTGSLPQASEYPAARVLILSGRTGGWKGLLSVHNWIVLKRANARSWSRYDVVGWGSPVRINGWAADGRWYGNRPMVVADIAGEKAEALIPKIEAAIAAYPYRQAGDYRIWPGPNSNTFVASMLRAIPDIAIALPSNAVGRDFRPHAYAGMSDSRTGIEASLWGVLGLKLGWVEGIEFNVLGLVAGLDLRHPAVKLPGFGHLGLDSITMSATADDTAAKKTAPAR